MKMIPHHHKTVDQKSVLTSIKIERVYEKASHPVSLKDGSVTGGTRGNEIDAGAEGRTIWWRLGNRRPPFWERYLNTVRLKSL